MPSVPEENVPSNMAYDRAIADLAREILRITSNAGDEEDMGVQSKTAGKPEADGAPSQHAETCNIPSKSVAVRAVDAAQTRGIGKLNFLGDKSSFVNMVMQRATVLQEADRDESTTMGTSSVRGSELCDDSISVRPAGLQDSGAPTDQVSAQHGVMLADPSSSDLVAAELEIPNSSPSENALDSSHSDAPPVAPEIEEDGGGTNSTATLEAIRVDDITVKAEPVQDDSRQRNLHMFLGTSFCSILLLVVILSTTLTRPSDNSQKSQEETLAPTYDPDTRLALLRELLLEELSPLYQSNFSNATDENTMNVSYPSATHLFQETLDNPETPQYQALLWLAKEDSQVAGIRQPMLEPGFIDGEGDISANSTGNTTTHLRHPQDSHHRVLIGLERIIQRYALAVLYYSTSSNTSDWAETFEFLGEQRECDWSGAILCDTNGALIHLDLNQNNLVGTIPIELGALASLELLDLNGNLLHGSLPRSLSRLTAIKTFDVADNRLSGTVPKSLFQNWKNIETWTMTSNKFTGTLPNEFGDLTDLQYAKWSKNQLAGSLPSSTWSNLTRMVDFDFSRQKDMSFSIGTEIGLWSHLESIIVFGLRLTGTIHTEIGLLTNMKYLGLANNDFTGTVPTQLGLLTNAASIVLSMTGVTGTVPTELMQCESLHRLFLQNTLVTGNVSFICDAVDAGIMKPMTQFRVDLEEMDEPCSCCTCCHY